MRMLNKGAIKLEKEGVGRIVYTLRCGEKLKFKIFPNNHYGKFVSMCIEATQKISLKSELF